MVLPDQQVQQALQVLPVPQGSEQLALQDLLVLQVPPGQQVLLAQQAAA